MSAAEVPAFEVGDRVEAGEGDDHDVGRIVEIIDGTAWVAWDSCVTTPTPIDLLRPVAS